MSDTTLYEILRKLIRVSELLNASNDLQPALQQQRDDLVREAALRGFELNADQLRRLGQDRRAKPPQSVQSVRSRTKLA